VSHDKFKKNFEDKAVEVERAPFPKRGESSWIIVFDNLTIYRRPVAKEECSKISISTGKSLAALLWRGFKRLSPKDFNVVEEVRRRGSITSHNRIT
ncbi:MAG: hypothetical protein RMH84_06570, partial [Sulfolobales archaeon]|nr:hypothetical protein [Sulfolobales archaeon]